MLNGGRKMRLIAMGAIERLERYTGTSTLALTGKITPHTDDPDGMWLYHSREWMEHRKVQIKPNDNKQMSNERPALMDIYAQEHKIDTGYGNG